MEKESQKTNEDCAEMVAKKDSEIEFLKMTIETLEKTIVMMSVDEMRRRSSQ